MKLPRLLCLWVCGCWLVSPLFAQSNRLIKELEEKRGALQRQIDETETLLDSTRRDVGSRLNTLASLTGQIEERRRYIRAINADVNTIGQEIDQLNGQLDSLQRDLADRREAYASSLQYLQRYRSIEEKLLFVFSARNLAQIYRRMRYVQEYAAYQQKQGGEILQKQEETRQKQTELLQVKAAKDSLLQEREAEQRKLEEQERQQRAIVADLQKRQQSLQNEIARKRREAGQLNTRIDKLIAEEMARQQPDLNSSTAAREEAELDNRLSDSFAGNQGKLPVPITGSYLIVNHYGQYTVKGLRNIRLDNKGIDIQGQPGAQARAVFRGKVAAVFQLNGLFNVLIRHGSYISAYCNLVSTSVKANDEVSTGQLLGPVFSDSAKDGRTVLHFQLHKEKEKLDPELWLER